MRIKPIQSELEKLRDAKATGRLILDMVAEAFRHHLPQPDQPSAR